MELKGVNAKVEDIAKVKAKAKATTRGKLLLAVIIVILLVTSYKCITSINKESHNRTIDTAVVTGDFIGISPRATGEIVQIYAKTGKTIKKGDVLYLLDGKELTAELKHAEAMLEIAKTELDKAVGGARIQEIVAAQTLVLQTSAEYESKVASRDSIKNSVNTISKTYYMLLKQMKNAIEPKSGSYDLEYAMKLLNNAYSKKVINDTQFTVQAQMLREQFNFKIQLEAQLAAMKGQLKSYNASIAASKAAVQNSESRLELVSDGASYKDMAILVSKVKVAQISYDEAKTAASHATVRATQNGTVMQVVAHKGEIAVPGKPVLYIADMNKLYIYALIDERQIDEVKLGQSVKCRLDLDKKVDFTGIIQEIGTTTIGILDSNSKNTMIAHKDKNKVPIKIAFDYKDKKMIPGMHVDIDIK